MIEPGGWPAPADGAEARALDLLGVGFLVGDGVRLLHVNEAAGALFGRSVADLLALGQVRSLLHPEDEHRISVTVADCRQRGLPVPERFTARIVRPGGATVPVELLVRAEVRGTQQRTYTFVHELTQQLAVREGLVQLALTDPLTGLPNRLAMEEQLRMALAGAAQRPSRNVLLFCDLDALKAINDTAGHAAGDEALAGFAGRLSEALRAGDTAARFGGDEFVALVEEGPGESPQELADRIGAATSFTLEVDDHRLPVSASIGWVAFDDASRSPADLLRAADAAMYEAKLRRRGS